MMSNHKNFVHLFGSYTYCTVQDINFVEISYNVASITDVHVTFGMNMPYEFICYMRVHKCVFHCIYAP